VHELSLCNAIADIALRRAEDRQVAAVQVRIGELRQVVPDTLAFCWTMITDGTTLAGSSLDVLREPARLHCRSCGHVFGLDDDQITLACRSCAGLNTAVLAGEELDVVTLDLVPA
jgi:hydrogenase nickel incorporation protein HypA/HybF